MTKLPVSPRAPKGSSQYWQLGFLARIVITYIAPSWLVMLLIVIVIVIIIIIVIIIAIAIVIVTLTFPMQISLKIWLSFRNSRTSEPKLNVQSYIVLI